MAAKRSAMENATKNAGEMIDKLTLTYNRGRQAVITNELSMYFLFFGGRKEDVMCNRTRRWKGKSIAWDYMFIAFWASYNRPYQLLLSLSNQISLTFTVDIITGASAL